MRHWNFLKGAWIETTNRKCGWTKFRARHQETWWNDIFGNSVKA